MFLSGTDTLTLATAGVARIILNATGGIGLEAGSGADSMLRVRGNSTTSGVNQWGIIADTIFGDDATSSGYTITSQVQTTASAFTMDRAAAFQVAAAEVGAGSTVTRLINVLLSNQTAGTNNASIADNITFTGDWLLNLNSSRKSLLGGPLSLEAGIGDDTMFRVRGNSQTSGVNQWGIIADTIFSSSGTSSGYTITSQVQTAAAAFTMNRAAAFQTAAASVGAGSTVTRLINCLLSEQTAGTNNASISDNITFAGNWFIHSTSTATSLFSGITQFAAGLRTIVSTANTANPPTDAELDSAFGAPATLGAGFVGILNDNNGGTNEYLCWADGTNWFYATGTKAV
jgi:hypothetical protein